jgi:hypothetical protein
MPNRLIRIVLLAALIAGAMMLPGEDFSLPQAKKIDDFLAHIAQRPNRGLFIRKVEFSEADLNSYLNLFYLKKYAPEVSWIHIALQDKNVASGSLKAKLVGSKYENVPQMFREFTLDFSGKIESYNGRMRYVFSDLAINGTHISPELLDEAMNTAQIGAKVKKSIYDWFTLLPGLKNLTIVSRSITFYY